MAWKFDSFYLERSCYLEKMEDCLLVKIYLQGYSSFQCGEETTKVSFALSTG